MANVLDVAAYILKKHGKMTALKLQKLVYYAQAWSLVWDDKPLFSARIEAWANGPVVPKLYSAHKGKYEVKSGDITGDAGALSKEEEMTIDAVLRDYGDKTSQWLSDLTHAEQPWQQARGGLSPSDRGANEITLEMMHHYYSSL